MKTIYIHEAGGWLSVLSRLLYFSWSRVRGFMVMTGRWSDRGRANHLITQLTVGDRQPHSNCSKLPQIFCQFFPNAWWWANKTCTLSLCFWPRYSWWRWAAPGCVSGRPGVSQGPTLAPCHSIRPQTGKLPVIHNSSNHQNSSVIVTLGLNPAWEKSALLESWKVSSIPNCVSQVPSPRLGPRSKVIKLVRMN